MIRIDKAISALRLKSIARPRVGAPPSSDQIANAEAQLGCEFPPSFLRFLAEAGPYQLPFWEPYWVGPCEREDIVEANLSERHDAYSPLPPFLVSFFNNGMGDHLCFDTRTISEDREYPIVFWDHEVSQKENLDQLETVASTFAEWLMGEVEQSDS